MSLLTLSLLLLALSASVAQAPAGSSPPNKYSSHQCIGGSQVLQTYPMSWAMRQGDGLSKFPMNDPQHRTCLLRNVCIANGNLTYYVSSKTASEVPQDYLPAGFDGKMFHVGHLRAFTIPLSTEVSEVPPSYTWHAQKTVYLDANSWTFNYGHYLIDNVLPTFFAAKIFNLNFSEAQQIFETSCRQFTTLPAKFANERVAYNKSLGTYRSACLDRIVGMHNLFYNHKPIFVEDYVNKPICFKQLMGGHGSTFGLKAVELSRGFVQREFREYVLDRLRRRSPQTRATLDSSQENLILVGIRSRGSAGAEIVSNLCTKVQQALLALPQYGKFRTECFVPADLSFEMEAAAVRRAKVLVSVHGTISYMSLFARDGTQQISIHDPKEYKENQTLLWMTHIQLLYLAWDKIAALSKVLALALSNSEAHFESQPV